MMLIAVVVLAAYDGGGGSIALSGTTSGKSSAQPVAVGTTACSTGNLFTIENKNTYPIWLGEFVGDPTKVVVPPQGWEMSAGSTVNLCTTPPWPSGRLWARTECDFTDLYQSSTGTAKALFTTCSADTDCNSLATTTGLSYDCMGGACMVDCSSQPSDKANAYCQGVMGVPSGNTQAICTNNDPWSKSYCTYPADVVCKTGDCAGLYQCVGTYTNGGTSKSQIVSGSAPATLFEPTSTNASTVNYDVSNVGGYNTDIQVTVSPQPTASSSYPNNCYQTACVSDLNQSCPVSLQVTEKPSSTTGPVSCSDGSGLYCQSGACEPCVTGSGQTCDAGNSDTCVIGCNDPGDQCATNASAPGLECTTAIPSGAAWTSDGSYYEDMYEAKNASGQVDKLRQTWVLRCPRKTRATRCAGRIRLLPPLISTAFRIRYAIQPISRRHYCPLEWGCAFTSKLTPRPATLVD